MIAGSCKIKIKKNGCKDVVFDQSLETIFEEYVRIHDCDASETFLKVPVRDICLADHPDQPMINSIERLCGLTRWCILYTNDHSIFVTNDQKIGVYTGKNLNRASKEELQDESWQERNVVRLSPLEIVTVKNYTLYVRIESNKAYHIQYQRLYLEPVKNTEFIQHELRQIGYTINVDERFYEANGFQIVSSGRFLL